MVNINLQKNIVGIIGILMLPLVCSANAAYSWYQECLSGPGLNFMLLVLGFVPIVLVEAIIIKKLIKGQRFLRVLVVSSVANVASTAVGYFLTALFSNWVRSIGYYNQRSICEGMTFTFFLIAMLVSFLLSVTIEYFVFKLFFKDVNNKIVVRAVWWVNIISYLLILSFTFVWSGYPDTFAATMIWK
jgi:hypothetical protein